MEVIDKNTIRLNKEINELDKFVFGFINILKKYTDYVIISGYVSILFGRARSTEDIDIFIKKLGKSKLDKLYKDLIKNGYWCLNAEGSDEIYGYLNEGLAVRFARKNETIPNFEVKFSKDQLDNEVFDDFIRVILPTGEIKISSLERHIAFKKYYLKSDKDIEDAEHIETLFKDKIDKEKTYKYKKQIEERK